MNPVPGTEAASLRVIKKLPVTARGALRLAAQFGSSLVCVRHRIDDRGAFRYTTVELLVSKTPIQARQEKRVHVRIGAREWALQDVMRRVGAEWDPRRRLWLVPQRMANLLKLQARIVAK